jgi:hypothetical protein
MIEKCTQIERHGLLSSGIVGMNDGIAMGSMPGLTDVRQVLS